MLFAGDRSRQPQQFILRRFFDGDDPLRPRLAFRQRSRLVDDHRPHAFKPLEGIRSVTDENGGNYDQILWTPLFVKYPGQSTGKIDDRPAQSIDIGADGTVSIIPQGEGPQTMAVVGRMRIVEAAQSQLARGGDGLMRPKDPQAPALPVANGNSLTMGVLEGSNVDAAGALVQMIQLQRQFEMQVKVIRSGDEMAQSSNQLLRLGG